MAKQVPTREINDEVSIGDKSHRKKVYGMNQQSCSSNDTGQNKIFHVKKLCKCECYDGVWVPQRMLTFGQFDVLGSNSSIWMFGTNSFYKVLQ